MLATPGCCAREDIGALFAGVFCGVLTSRVNGGQIYIMYSTYGAVRSTPWFLNGVAIMNYETAVKERNNGKRMGKGVEVGRVLKRQLQS